MKKSRGDQELQDLRLAIALLDGVWTAEGANPALKNDDRFPGKRYLSGQAEIQARQAIGRLLRSDQPLDSALRDHLAELFDGDEPYISFDGTPKARRIVFEYRQAGTPRETTLRNLHLASDYNDLREQHLAEKLQPLPHKKAIDQLCKKYGVSDTVVKEALRANPSLARRAAKKRIDRLR